jgi:hypothetical protein
MKISPAASDKWLIQAQAQLTVSWSPDISELKGNNVVMHVPVILSTSVRTVHIHSLPSFGVRGIIAIIRTQRDQCILRVKQFIKT